MMRKHLAESVVPLMVELRYLLQVGVGRGVEGEEVGRRRRMWGRGGRRRKGIAVHVQGGGRAGGHRMLATPLVAPVTCGVR